MYGCHLRKWTSHGFSIRSLTGQFISPDARLSCRSCRVCISLHQCRGFFSETSRLGHSPHSPPQKGGKERRNRDHHQQSKQAGKKAALGLSLNYSGDSNTSAKMNCFQGSAWKNKKCGAETNAFRSSFDYRVRGGNYVLNDLVRRKDFVTPSRAAPAASTTTGPLVLPNSFLAYRTLLYRGSLANIKELVASPYAPAPLEVICEVLHEISSLKERIHSLLNPSLVGLVGESYRTRSESSTHTSPFKGSSELHSIPQNLDGVQDALQRNQSLSTPLPICNSFDNQASNTSSEDELEALIISLHRLESLMSRPLDLRTVFHKVDSDMQNVVQACDTIGDRQCDIELQNSIQQVKRLAIEVFEQKEQGSEAVSFMTPKARSCTEGGNFFDVTTLTEHLLANSMIGKKCDPGLLHRAAAVLIWRLPSNVHAELLRGILQLSRHLCTHLIAVEALERLIHLSNNVFFKEEHRVTTHRSTKNVAESQNTSVAIAGKDPSSFCPSDNKERHPTEAHEFCVDEVAALLDRGLQAVSHGVVAQDHLFAIMSCQRVGDFETAYSLYRRFLQHAKSLKHENSNLQSISQRSQVFHLTTEELAESFTALAYCVQNTNHFNELRSLLTTDEITKTIPVSVPLYTALIHAVSKAVKIPDQMSIALAFYRRLRDGLLVPTVETYAALMACCASTREPTQAFAFYHEARQIYGVQSFTSKMYTNLLLSYANAGFGADARRTLDVLVEAGAPLTSSAFHAVLSCALSLREAEEVVEMMVNQYHIAATPHTYAFLVRAAMKHPLGVQTVLKLFDLHQEATASLLKLTPNEASESTSSKPGTHTSSHGHMAVSIPPESATLGQRLLENYPFYVRSLEHALIQLRLDPYQDARLSRYLKPLVRVSQQRMNAFTEMVPQAPTFIPTDTCACLAVLAPDVLANIDELVMPFVAYYSVIAIPYSSLLALQVGQVKRVREIGPESSCAHTDGISCENFITEHDTILKSRRKRLIKFLKDYREVIHLVSLEEEMGWSRDIRRYGILNMKDLQARSAAFALNLSRRDIVKCMKLYANNERLSIILVSTNYSGCGRYVVDLKKACLASSDSSAISDKAPKGLRDGLGKVFYHNPYTQPNWAPPTLSIQASMRKHATDVQAAVRDHNQCSPQGKEFVIERRGASTELASDLYSNGLFQSENGSSCDERKAASKANLHNHISKLNRVGSKPTSSLEPFEPETSNLMFESNQEESIEADVLMAMLSA